MSADGNLRATLICLVSIIEYVTYSVRLSSYPFLLFDISYCLTYRWRVVKLVVLVLGSVLCASYADCRGYFMFDGG